MSKIKSSEITSELNYNRRRDFMKKGLILGAGTIFSKDLLAEPNPKTLKKQLTKNRHITNYNNFYEFTADKEDVTDLAKGAKLSKADWSIELAGECDNPKKITLEDIVKLLKTEERIYRFRCVEGWSMVIPWQGFELNKLLALAKPNSKAKFVAFETLEDDSIFPNQKKSLFSNAGIEWPYREGLRIDEAMNPLTLMATGIYGKDLLNQSGAPIRLVVPWKYGFKSIKSIVKIKFVEKQPLMTWNMLNAREYGFYSNVNPSVDHPRWSQKKERIIGSIRKRKTEMFNGYQDEVASLYKGMDLKKFY